MTFETGIVFFISLVLLWLKPGPGQALRLTYALQNGFWPAFMISLGVLTVCLGYFTFVALGYSALSQSSQFILLALKLMGALYLLYLGLMGLKKGKGAHNLIDKAQTVGNAKGIVKDYSLGLLMASSNPITIFYFVGILPTLVPVGRLSQQDFFLGLLLIVLAAILVDALLILLTVFTKEAFAGGNFFKHISKFTSISFILIGLFLLYGALFMPGGLVFSMI